MKLIRILLIPFSLLYSVILWCRHAMYNAGLLRSNTFTQPVISVGNLSLGGTGKTPFTQYVAKLLQDRKKVAILSRGYKRKSTGFACVSPNDMAEQVGDEPLLLAQSLPKAIIAVDANRSRGLQKLFSEYGAEVALLDDGMQHRKVKPALQILLTDYHNRYTNDWLLPAGRLRDIPSRAKAAQIIVVSKCPESVDFEKIVKEINPLPGQHVFFTRLKHRSVQPILGDQNFPIEFLKDKGILIVTGIAKPEYLVNFAEEHSGDVRSVIFGDHHAYNADDLHRVTEIFDNFDAPTKLVLTTAKDAVKLRHPALAQLLLKLPVYVLDAEVEFMKDREIFERELRKYA